LNDPNEIFNQIVSQLMARPGVTAAKMFGLPSLKVNGKAFSCLYQGEMVFKLEGEAHTRALSLEGAALFDPTGRGRLMREWVQLPAIHAAEWSGLAKEACEYVARIS
jgi:hypothetical protein